MYLEDREGHERSRESQERLGEIKGLQNRSGVVLRGHKMSEARN